MIRLAVSGATGRMGQAVIRLASEESAFQVGAVLDKANSDYENKGVGEISPFLDADCIKEIDLTKVEGRVDLLVDFTQPEATLVYVEQAARIGLPVVTGTTGLMGEELEKIANASKKIPLLVAPNMSLGMSVLMAFAGKLAKALGNDFDTDILETHHRNKKDAPSGSALRIGEYIAKAKGRELGKPSFDTSGPRDRDGDLRFQSIRSGGVVGDHAVIFGSDYETVELSHRALTRDVFARGSLRAAQWLLGKPKGLYNMFDVLGVQV